MKPYHAIVSAALMITMAQPVWAFTMGKATLPKPATLSKNTATPAKVVTRATPALSRGTTPNAINSPVITGDEYLIQKVCFKEGDVTKTALAVDPYMCLPQNRRPLRLGETIPYRKHDWKAANDTSYNPHGFQYSESFALKRTAQGNYTYLSTMQLAEGATLTYSAQNLPYFNPDGYNVLSTGGGWANFSGTKDQSGAAQSFYGRGCQRDNSWLLFPLNRSFTSANMGAELKLIREGESCTTSTVYDKSLLEFSYLPSFTYTSNKSMSTVKAVHWGAATVEDTAKYPGAGYEVTYFTNVYGMTRWEAWTRKQDGGTVIGAPYCNGTTEYARGGTTWIRTGCRDWTYVTTTTQAGTKVQFSPYSVKVDASFGPINLLKDTDFTAWTGAWKRYDGAQLVNWQILTDPRSYRKNLAYSCPGTCNGNVLYQTVPVASTTGKTKISFGSQGWVDSGTAGANYQLFQLNSAGKAVAIDTLAATYSTDAKAQYIKSVTLNPNTRTLLFAIYPQKGATNYHLTNPWVVLE